MRVLPLAAELADMIGKDIPAVRAVEITSNKVATHSWLDPYSGLNLAPNAATKAEQIHHFR